MQLKSKAIKLLCNMIIRLCLNESWVILFVLGLIMTNFPFLAIFNKHETVSGIPLLFLYLMIGWPISIFVIYLFNRAVNMCEEEKGEKRVRR